MALNNSFSIPTSAQGPRTASKSTVKANQQSRSLGSFAAVMAQEQSAPKPQAQIQPVVARLPETGLPLRSSPLAGRTPNDMLKMSAFNNASNDLLKTRALSSFIENTSAQNGSLGAASSLNAAKNLRVVAGGNNGQGFALSGSDYIHTSNLARLSKSRQSKAKTETVGIGKLSAQFESGKDGIAAIGYDSTGGTSYGKYQIASKVGSMKSFLTFLDSEAPDIASKLRKAGPANTGSRRGGMPDAWRKIAKEQPERFEQLQEAFIHQSHYKPALEAIEQRTGIDSSSLSTAMREVIWSTAVQHGPAGAAKIFARADGMSGKPEDAGYERKMISNVYAVRAGQFGSSTSSVRDAVRNRFRQERQLALKMLDNDATPATLA